MNDPLYVANTCSVVMSFMFQLLEMGEKEISVFRYPFQYGLQHCNNLSENKLSEFFNQQLQGHHKFSIRETHKIKVK